MRTELSKATAVSSRASGRAIEVAQYRREIVRMRKPWAAIVVAHPDDEALWLSSAIASVERTVLCFGTVFERPRESNAREQAVAALPLTGLIHLAIPESGVDPRLDRAVPKLTAEIRIADAYCRARYQSNSAKLSEALRPALCGFREVYTHNPWGEYGHLEHIQVYRAVAALQADLGYTIWFSNYVSAQSWPLARGLSREVCCAERRIVQPDRNTAIRLMRVYRQYGAWTWSNRHRWPAQETFFCQPPADDPAPRRPLCGEWLLDAMKLRLCSPPWLPARRRLPDPDESPRRDVRASLAVDTHTRGASAMTVDTRNEIINAQ
ncbi:MAG: hypothetical protein ACREUT_20900 [Steroidobacteraceae bacterium]